MQKICISIVYGLFMIGISCITGCKYGYMDSGITKPGGFRTELDYGSPDYRQGYADGCQSGYGGYGNSFNKMFSPWKQDPNQVTNPVYYQVWKDAYTYCAFAAMMHDEMALGNWR
jgi:hypothetical protein